MTEKDFLEITALLDVQNAHPHVFVCGDVFNDLKSIFINAQNELDIPFIKYNGNNPCAYINCYCFILDDNETYISGRDKNGNKINFGRNNKL